MSRTTGSIYAAYDQMIARVEASVASYDPRIAGCESADVRARIVQRIVQLTADEFSAQAIKGAASRESFSGGGLTIAESGKVSISLKLWAVSAAYFIASWLEVTAGFLRGLRTAAPVRSTPSTILMEAGGGYEYDDQQFVRFCREGPVEPLAHATEIVVQASQAPRRSVRSNVSYAPRALAYVINATLSARDRRAALTRHLLAPFRYVAALVRCPLAVLVSRDLSLVPVVGWLDRADLIEAVIVTTSAFPAQPLWMKGLAGQRFALHMVWYSQNFVPKMYVGETERSSLPAARHMRVDVHWVWTRGFEAYLRELGSTSRVEVVGPLLWYLPETTPTVRDGSVKIAVFDITPLPDGQTAFGALKNYYSVTTIARFITDIVETAEALAAESGRQVRVLIKHKRAPKAGYHDSSYLEMLEAMARVKPHVALIDHHTNLFGLLSECDLSISVPWTSTAYVGAHLGKPGIYYDPFGELVATHEPNPFVHFAAGPDALRRTIRQCVAFEPIAS